MLRLKNITCLVIFISLIVGLLPNTPAEAFAENNTTSQGKYLHCKDVEAGMNFSLAIKGDGTVIACGQNNYGQCIVPAGLSNVKAVAAGDYHAVALKENGTVVAWGDNSRGQCTIPSELGGVKAIAAGPNYTIALLENGTLVRWGESYEDLMSIPEGLSGVKSIAAGDNYILALKEDGTVVAWGENSYGQTSVPEGLCDVVAIAAGAFHSLALKNDGTVVAWGYNNQDQCSIPTGLTNVKSIAAGALHSVALKDDGTVVAWGDSLEQQCSVPSDLGNVKDITAGKNYTIALKDDGTLAAWGDNEYNQYSFIEHWGINALAASRSFTLLLKEDGTVSISLKTVSLSTSSFSYGSLLSIPANLKDVTAIAAGDLFAMALKKDGTVTAWGDNYRGQCDIPNGLTNVKAVAAGLEHSVALKEDGTVIAWGNNSQGQCDIPAGLSKVKAIAAGGYNTAALKEDGTVVVWGSNNNNQCTTPEGLNSIKAISVGEQHILALTEDGAVIAWGSNSYQESTVPPELSKVKAISAGDYYSSALVEDGTVVNWGDCPWGRSEIYLDLTGVKAVSSGTDHIVALKDSGSVIEYDNVDSYTAYFPLSSTKVISPLIKLNTWKKIYSANGTCIGLLDDDSLWQWRTHYYGYYILDNDKFTSPVKLLENISDVAIGQGYIMALAKDKKLWTWGTNYVGELGNGSNNDQLQPQNVMNDVIKICTSKESSSSFAIKSDGSLWGWGNNFYGQLGDKTDINKNTPVKIMEMEGVKSVVSGQRNTLAIKEDNSLWAWGDNSYGQLGNGTYEKSYIPVKIMEDVNKAVTENGSCYAIKDDNTLWSWGNNNYLQLGNALTIDKINTPEKVLDDVSDVTPAMQSVYAIMLDKSLYGWGSNIELGYYKEESTNSSKPLKHIENITKVSAYYQIVALDEKGTAWNWGYNDTYSRDQLSYAISAPSILSDNVIEIATDYGQSSYIKSDGSLFQVNYSEGIALDPINIAVEPYIDTISISNNFATVKFSGAPLDSVYGSDFTISSVTTDEAGQTVTGNVYSRVNSFDTNTNIAVLQLFDIPNFDKELMSFNVSYKGHLAVNAKEIAATATAVVTPTPTGTPAVTPTPFSTPKATTTCTLKPTEICTLQPTATSTPKPTAVYTLQPTATSTPKPTAIYTLQPTATSTPKPVYNEHRIRKTPVPTIIQPTGTIPGDIPLPSLLINDIEYKKTIQDVKDEFTGILKKYEGIDDPYNEKNELVTKMAEKTIEKISTQKVICQNGSIEIKQELIQPQIEFALKAAKDIKDLLATQSYEPNRVIRKRINIDVDLTETQLTISMLKDINGLVKDEVDLKITTKFGNIIIPYENIERLLNKGLIIIMTDENAKEDTKIKSKVNLLFKCADGTIIENLNAKIELELPYGDGNPDYCTIYKELTDNLYNSDKQNSTKNTTLPVSTASLLKMQSPKIELAFPLRNGMSDYHTAYGISDTKKYNMGGYEDTENKTLRTSITSCGKYYVIEEKITFHDINNEDASVKEAIELLAVKGIINGRDDGAFHPGDQLKRSELASLIVRCLNIIDEGASTNLKDVKKTAWYYNAVAIACEEGLISGYENNTFQGNKIINRQEITTICSNTLNIKKGYSFTSEDKWLNFSDKGIIPMWARKFVALGNREGLVIKRTDRKFNGIGLCTRKDAAVILYRFYKKL